MVTSGTFLRWQYFFFYTAASLGLNMVTFGSLGLENPELETCKGEVT